METTVIDLALVLAPDAESVEVWYGEHIIAVIDPDRLPFTSADRERLDNCHEIKSTLITKG